METGNVKRFFRIFLTKIPDEILASE